MPPVRIDHMVRTEQIRAAALIASVTYHQQREFSWAESKVKAVINTAEHFVKYINGTEEDGFVRSDGV